SYLFGTMHVSSKIAFHLADSFYLGIRNADMVALETNPESWQEDMSKYDLEMGGYADRFMSFFSMPSDYLSINTLKFYKYDKKIERSLYSNPSTINNLLYRSYGNESSDFEEDTYLDMYIYQCGKKWGKKVAGVENYGESMKLMQEAYKDASKDKNRKERSYDIDEDYSMGKLQEAYRKGNLDQLDSINKLNSFSDAFDEKFMYRRNEIQANSIDSILKSKISLFVGVGAAHLPGNRGVIEILRQRGYKLRPVMMGERDSKHKDQVEKLRVPVTFNTEAAEDGFYKVDIPGKFFKFGDDPGLDQQQYADMANGSYYMVTRVMTNAWLWGHNTEDVYKKVDSLLYENIPGKILSKTRIVRNGYNGFDITNKTRRGDIQRYNIFITGFEIIFFKMGGNGEYVTAGPEAEKFFGSIQLKDYKSAANVSNGWKKYSPPYGGFSVELPHEPFIGNDGSWIYDAEEKTTGTSYRIIRTDIHNYHFAEEDTFDLGLMAESFAASEFIDTLLSRKQGHHKGYPSLDCKYRTRSGATLLAKFLIQGPHYYTLVAGGKQVTDKMNLFLNSFEIKPLIYGEVKARIDTSLYFSVKSPVFPEDKKEKLDIPRYNMFNSYDDDEEEETEEDMLEGGAFRSKLISNDTTGEKIFVSFYKSPRYYYSKDSFELKWDEDFDFSGDSSWIVKSKKQYELPNKTRVWESVLTDTGSSRSIITKSFYKDGVGFSLMTQSDTLTKPSSFIKSFFDSFDPVDTLKGVDPFQKKSAVFFADFMSADSSTHKRAVKSIESIDIDSTDLPQLKKAISWLTWDKKNYLDIKRSLIGKLDDITTKAASDYLKEVYYNAGDTVELQYAALENLLQQRTQYAFNTFRDIVVSEPPILNSQAGRGWTAYPPLSSLGNYFRGLGNYNNNSFLDELHDTLKLTRSILPDLLPLVNLEDYKSPIMRLLGQLIDSNLVKPKDYEIYFSKFLIEAKQELKKQAIAEKTKAIQKAEDSKKEKKAAPSYYPGNEDEDQGNDDLALYATLLLPYWDINPTVQPVIAQMLASNDKKLKYNTLLQMLRHGKPVNDTLLNFFAGLDDFRYELYSDLKEMKKMDKFPAKYNNHLDLGKSSLMGRRSYGKPDTLVYIDRLPAEMKGRKGFVYFYKYKLKKEDVNWKLATVGLVPEDPKQFEFEKNDKVFPFEWVVPGWHTTLGGRYGGANFTGFLDTKLKDDEPISDQLKNELKKKLYSLRKSARNFYSERDNDRFDFSSRIDIGGD
ncbi:MAG TPA: TraB/GumN family protein, partial [Chitinophagaceae bacterium]